MFENIKKLKPETTKDADYWNNLATLAIEDEAALTELYNHFFPKVYKFLMVKLKNTDAADDLASSVFMKMYKGLEGFDSEKASFATWLNRIAANEIKMYFRTKSRKGDKETEWDEDFEPPADDAYEPEKQALEKERAQELKSAIMTLPERERQIIEMTYWLNLTPKEIAAEMDMTPNHVSVSLRRAKQMLKERLAR